MTGTWVRVADRMYRMRLRFLDVTVGVVWGDDAVVLIDCGTNVDEATRIDRDVQRLTGRPVDHLVLTHHHFDHILGAPVFAAAQVYAAPAVGTALTARAAALYDDAVAHGADPAAVTRALAAVAPVAQPRREALLALGDRCVAVRHLGAGHTDHDLVVLVELAGPDDPTVVFCGDLVEQSGDPVVDVDSDPLAWPRTLDRLLAAGGPDARYVPGHGAVVGADFVAAQRDWLAAGRFR
ncbi:MBL fold metallo-hydrolase [Mycolicibacillus parakoreensis]|uniref:MBL fold metallo-hydrolase n=2 Tax=Mycolicibacillus parakoreensis TaxID=1069221 RepID=A0ABY3U6F8_9MYCO|nr:MBL fold metallo-hydrolase [Mycolicibacillus parakoreensis]ULN54151.1 MBL fold metallo-hydrolase [Mycolicibacillus parakoreensis]